MSAMTVEDAVYCLGNHMLTPKVISTDSAAIDATSSHLARMIRRN
jgi:hypothetical protein